MAEDDMIGKILRRAISDPGSYTGERQVLHEGWAGPEYESLTYWQVRAVLAALGGAGYGIVRTEGAVTEWGLRLTGESCDPMFHAYPSKEAAQADVRTFQGVFDTVVVWHLVGPWTVAAGTCRHCGAEIVPCTARPAVHKLDSAPDLFCKGWKHAASALGMPVGAHCCDGRSINPSAEPAPETVEGADDA